MLNLNAGNVRENLPWKPLIDALNEAFRKGVQAPPRQHYEIGEDQRTLLVMPAWQNNGPAGVKLSTSFPANTRVGLPSLAGVYILFDGDTGQPRALLDGAELTSRRTAAASALAASYMARKDSRILTVAGTGRLSRNLVEAHKSVRPIDEVWIWGRNPEKAQQVVDSLRSLDVHARVAADLRVAVGRSDIVSTATLATAPLVRGAWLEPGTHLDLVGSFKPTMRETDSAVWVRAETIVVDTREGVFAEAGDLICAEAEGAKVFSRVAGDLFDLIGGEIVGRQNDKAITVFKSVGMSLEDLAAAILAVETMSTQG